MGLKIIVIDDDPLSPKLIRALAASLGHAVFTFEDHFQARQRAESQRFDVAFVGMNPLKPEGFETARLIRSLSPNLEIAIVMLSTSDDVQSLRKAFGEGADLVLGKPLATSSLRPMLAAMSSPDWKRRTRAARLPLFTEVLCTWGDQQIRLRSMNISESGMLLQPSLGAEVDEEISVEFKIPGTRITLQLLARITRKEESATVAVEFLGLTPENRNAVQLYVMGRLKDPAVQKRSDFNMPWFPNQ